MADNYLERRMEEYRAGRLVSVPGLRRTSRLGHAPGTLVVEYPQLRVVCLLSDATLSSAVVRAFREVDCKVAFCDEDMRRGNALSQSVGARFYCHQASSMERLQRTVDDVKKAWGGIDVLVCDAGATLASADWVSFCVSYENIGGDETIIKLPRDTSRQILAAMVRFMAHPSNRPVDAVHICLC